MQLDKIIMKEGMVHAYSEIADAADKSANETEEVMLFHYFDHDPYYQQKFVSTPVYRESDVFLFRGDNSLVQEDVEKQMKLAMHFSIEIYGNVSDEVIEKTNSLEFPLKHFSTSSVG
ncbi:MAG: hypothetical protein VW602_05505 [Paracoccaceae bacterium]